MKLFIIFRKTANNVIHLGHVSHDSIFLKTILKEILTKIKKTPSKIQTKELRKFYRKGKKLSLIFMQELSHESYIAVKYYLNYL